MDPQSCDVSRDVRSTRDDTRTNGPRSIRDLGYRDVFVIDARPTR